MMCVHGSDAVGTQPWLSMQLGRHAIAVQFRLPIVHLASSKMLCASRLAFSYGPHAAASDACVIATITVDKQAGYAMR